MLNDPPLIIHDFPSSDFTAVVCKPITSLPAWASEMAKQMNFFPLRMSGTTLALTSSLPKLRTGGRPITFPARRPSIQRQLRIYSKLKNSCERTITIASETTPRKFLSYYELR